MNSFSYNRTARKRACNVSINDDLLTQAKEAGIGISGVVEEALAKKLKEHSEQVWRERNAAALDDYNARIERDGTFAEQEGLL